MFSGGDKVSDEELLENVKPDLPVDVLGLFSGGICGSAITARQLS